MQALHIVANKLTIIASTISSLLKASTAPNYWRILHEAILVLINSSVKQHHSRVYRFGLASI